MIYGFDLQNLNLIVIAFVTAVTGVLGFVVFFSNPKSTTNKIFLAFSFSVIIWSFFNYLSDRFDEPWMILFVLRMLLFSVIWYSFFFFQLCYILSGKRFTKKYKLILVPWILSISLLVLTPFTFRSIKEFKGVGHVAIVNQSFGITLFGITVLGLIVGGLYVLFQRIRSTSKEEKKRFSFVWIGAFITFSLQILFNFILPTLFEDTRFVSLGVIFTLPLVFGVVYAIIRHHLLNIRILATEALIFLIVIFSIFDIIIPKSGLETVFRIATFVIVFAIGILLIRSIRREINQRDILRELNEKLDGANHNLQAKVDEQTQEIRKAYEVEKVARIELERLDETKNQFITLTQHHLRTPLTTLRWCLSPLMSGELGHINPKASEAVRGAVVSTERLSHLIDTFLDVTQFQAGKNILRLEPTDLSLLMGRVIDELHFEAVRAHVVVHYDRASASRCILAVDPIKMKEVFFSVLQNAIRYNHPDGSVDVSLEKTKECVRIAVRDTGVGVPKSEQEDLFMQLFHRGASAREHDALGMGLGLSVARLFVEAHHGRIWLESEGSGKGSQVYIELPASPLSSGRFD